MPAWSVAVLERELTYTLSVEAWAVCEAVVRNASACPARLESLWASRFVSPEIGVAAAAVGAPS
jgi:hypothetical protein